jgi:hypothetical protein
MTDQNQNNEMNHNNHETNVNWIPKLRETPSPRTYRLNCLINLKFVDEKQDKYKRDIIYFEVLNPESLVVVREDAQNRQLDFSRTFFSFWSTDDNRIMIKFNKSNLNNNVSPLTENSIYSASVGFKLYGSKSSKGYISVLNDIKPIDLD